MEQLGAAAFGISLFGGVHDLLTRRIPNWLTFPAMVLGIAMQGWIFGWAGGLDSVLGIALGFALFFPIHAFGYMGAGDVKLLMAVGAWLGWQNCLQVAVGSIVIGAAYALVEILWRGRFLAVVKNTYFFLRSVLVPGLVVEKLKLDESRKFAFGICIALAVAGLIYLRHAGRLP
jgi:prepilin peptidase CpaA